jgi:hypothetical protein
LKTVNQTQKKLLDVNVTSSIRFLKKRKIGRNKLKIRNKGNRKTNFIFWNFKDQKNVKIGQKNP